MKTAWLILGILGSLVISAAAQLDSTIVTRTNIVQAAPNFREVNGQLYNTSLSKLWQVQAGKILDVKSNGVVLQTYTNQIIYEDYYAGGNSQQRKGAYSSAPIGWQKRITGENKIESRRLFIKNYRIGAVDQEISVPAMKTGIAQIAGTVFEEWDCGLPHIVTNVVTSKVKVK